MRHCWAVSRMKSREDILVGQGMGFTTPHGISQGKTMGLSRAGMHTYWRNILSIDQYSNHCKVHIGGLFDEYHIQTFLPFPQLHPTLDWRQCHLHISHIQGCAPPLHSPNPRSHGGASHYISWPISGQKAVAVPRRVSFKSTSSIQHLPTTEQTFPVDNRPQSTLRSQTRFPRQFDFSKQPSWRPSASPPMSLSS
jgi:hypothetical protein